MLLFLGYSFFGLKTFALVLFYIVFVRIIGLKQEGVNFFERFSQVLINQLEICSTKRKTIFSLIKQLVVYTNIFEKQR